MVKKGYFFAVHDRNIYISPFSSIKEYLENQNVKALNFLDSNSKDSVFFEKHSYYSHYEHKSEGKQEVPERFV